MAAASDNLKDRTIRLPPYALSQAEVIARRMTLNSCNTSEVTSGEVLRRACILGLDLLEKKMEDTPHG